MTGLLSRPAIAGTGSVAAPRPAGFQDDRAYYFILLSVAVVAVVFAENLLRTRIGRALIAVRDQDIAASVIGVNVARYKLLAFGVSSFYAGIAGALLGPSGPERQLRAVSARPVDSVPGDDRHRRAGQHPGALLGAVFITLLPILLRNVVGAFDGVLGSNAAVLLSSAQFFLFGLVIVLFMVIEPQGLARLWRNVKDYVRLWPFSY